MTRAATLVQALDDLARSPAGEYDARPIHLSHAEYAAVIAALRELAARPLMDVGRRRALRELEVQFADVYDHWDAPDPAEPTCGRCGLGCAPEETQGCDACLERDLERMAEAACRGDSPY